MGCSPGSGEGVLHRLRLGQLGSKDVKKTEASKQLALLAFSGVSYGFIDSPVRSSCFVKYFVMWVSQE